jgi:hypothetical protein
MKQIEIDNCYDREKLEKRLKQVRKEINLLTDLEEGRSILK